MANLSQMLKLFQGVELEIISTAIFGVMLLPKPLSQFTDIYTVPNINVQIRLDCRTLKHPSTTKCGSKYNWAPIHLFSDHTAG